jgi:hypothetical protein
VTSLWMLSVRCSGIGGRGHAALPACPLALGALSADQFRGLYPQRDGELAYRPGICSPAQGFQLLDGCVGNAGQLRELPLREALSPTMRSKTGQRGASGPLDHTYSLLVADASFISEVPKRAEAA